MALVKAGGTGGGSLACTNNVFGCSHEPCILARHVRGEVNFWLSWGGRGTWVSMMDALQEILDEMRAAA